MQNKGIPVNEMYEQDGIKDIPTERFKDIITDENGGMAGNQSSMMFSFYSDDSFELIPDNPPGGSSNGNVHGKLAGLTIPQLNLGKVAEY